MWRKRWQEAESRASNLADRDPMSSEWNDTLDRLVALRAEMREIGRATGWVEDSASWAVEGMSETLQAEHGALVTAQKETDHARG